MRDLSSVIETTGWQWTQFTPPFVHSKNFWVGTDRDGNRWLTKLSGDFYAYREIVFGKLAQKMNWSCQSTIFICLDSKSARLLGKLPGEVHGAHWFLDEHCHPPCTEGCELAPLVNRLIGSTADLDDLSIKNILDWPKSEISACLFGGNEPPGRLFTSSHEFVIIDSEQMFSSRPCSFENTRWCSRDETAPTKDRNGIALEVCHDLLALRKTDIEYALKIPNDVFVTERWPIAPLLFSSVEYAKEFIKYRHLA